MSLNHANHTRSPRQSQTQRNRHPDRSRDRHFSSQIIFRMALNNPEDP
jgi:hypothetical protein